MVKYTVTDPKALGTFEPVGDLINLEGELGTYKTVQDAAVARRQRPPPRRADPDHHHRRRRRRVVHVTVPTPASARRGPVVRRRRPDLAGERHVDRHRARRRRDGLGQRLADDGRRRRRARALRRGPRGPGALGPPDARRDVRLRRGRRRTRSAGDHRRCRRGGPPAGDARRQDHRARARRAGGQPPPRPGWTRCTRSCRCPAASRWRRSPSARPGRPTPPCSPWRCWRSTTTASPGRCAAFRAEQHDAAAASVLPAVAVAVIVPPATLGILGGGQLGRYFVIAARTMGYRTMVLEPDPGAPAGALADVHLVAAYDDPAALARMAAECAVVTTEFENPPAAALARLAADVVGPSLAARHRHRPGPPRGEALPRRRRHPRRRRSR